MTGLYTCGCRGKTFWSFTSPDWYFCLLENVSVSNLPFAIFCGILNNIAVGVIKWIAKKLRFKT